MSVPIFPCPLGATVIVFSGHPGARIIQIGNMGLARLIPLHVGDVLLQVNDIIINTVGDISNFVINESGTVVHLFYFDSTTSTNQALDVVAIFNGDIGKWTCQSV
jgi:hypothetical protein